MSEAFHSHGLSMGSGLQADVRGLEGQDLFFLVSGWKV